MAAHAVRARDKSSLTRFLGWFSVALGSAQLGAPRALCRVVGASGDARSRTVMRLMGGRELVHGLGILVRPRPTVWLWSRVAGDALDLSLLGLTAARPDGGRGRAAFAIANVVAVAAADVAESLRLSRKRGEPRTGMLVRKAVTINRPRGDVEAAWAAADELKSEVAKAGGSVRFDDAPRGRGTELAVEFVHAPAAGDLGAAAEKLTGKDLPTQLSDGLRRLKQEIETGDVVRTEGSPEGHRLARHLKPRPARPLEEGVR
jgi:uncharacterized membrane protein